MAKITTDRLPVPFKLNLCSLETILSANDFWFNDHGTWFHNYKPVGISISWDTEMQYVFINMTGDGAKAIPIKVSINDIDLSKAILNNLIFAIHHVC